MIADFARARKLSYFDDQLIASHHVDEDAPVVQCRVSWLIKQLADYVRSSGVLNDVCNCAVKGLKKNFLHMILRQYDPEADQKRPRSAMIDHFTKLNMADAEEKLQEADHYGAQKMIVELGNLQDTQVVDFESSGRKLRKVQRKMHEKWMKGARLLRRKFLSKATVAELKRCLRGDGSCTFKVIADRWTVASLRDHVASVVDHPLQSGHARVFFNMKLQDLLFSRTYKRSRKKVARVMKRDFAVPRKNFTVIADPERWREMMAMRSQDMRT